MLRSLSSGPKLKLQHKDRHVCAVKPQAVYLDNDKKAWPCHFAVCKHVPKLGINLSDKNAMREPIVPQFLKIQIKENILDKNDLIITQNIIIN